MNKKPHIAERSANRSATVQALCDFDPEAWTTLLAEQRARIAMAAGVDPSKVKIHFGH